MSWGRKFNMNVLLMLSGTKVHLHKRKVIFEKNDVENAHDIMKYKTSEYTITVQSETTH